MGYDEDRPAEVTAAEQEAAASVQAAEDRVAELQKNREPDYDSAEGKLGLLYGLPGTASATPRDTGDAEYVSPRHSGTGEWVTGGGGAGPKAAARKAKAEPSSG